MIHHYIYGQETYLFENILRKQSFLCIGLDTDLKKITDPSSLTRRIPSFAFNKSIIDATADFCVAYKPNLAFYECMGVKGHVGVGKDREIHPFEKHPDQFIIADAKRGDIGNTSEMYAASFFEELPFDAVTVAPYMGEDSVKPFLKYEGKWVISIGLDFQQRFSRLPVHQRRQWRTPLRKSAEDLPKLGFGRTNDVRGRRHPRQHVHGHPQGTLPIISCWFPA